MKYFSKEEIMNGDSMFRRHLVNSLSGYKSANLIGTISDTGVPNLSMVSSVVHIGASPPLQGFVMRPLTVERQTYEYIKKTEVYTINHVHRDFIDKAHYASAKFEKNQSEFEACQLTPSFLDGHKAPYVEESHVRLGMRYEDEYVIRQNGTILIIGSVEHIYVDEQALSEDGHIDLSTISSIAVSGLESYYEAQKYAHFTFARVGQWPQKKSL